MLQDGHRELPVYVMCWFSCVCCVCVCAHACICVCVRACICVCVVQGMRALASSRSPSRSVRLQESCDLSSKEASAWVPPPGRTSRSKMTWEVRGAWMFVGLTKTA